MVSNDVLEWGGQKDNLLPLDVTFRVENVSLVPETNPDEEEVWM